MALLDGLIAYYPLNENTGFTPVAFDHVGDNHAVSVSLEDAIKRLTEPPPDEPLIVR